MGFKINTIPTSKKVETNSGKGDWQDLLKKEIKWFGNSFSDKKKQEFYSELHVLLKAGITIKEALQLFIETQKKEEDQQMFKKIVVEIINGKSLSEALLNSKKFSEYEYHSLKIGEETGTIAQVCLQLGVFFERKNEQKRIVIAALTYPSIVLFTAIVVVVFMLTYVVPMFQGIFQQNKMELPFITQLIISMSQGLQNYGWIVLILVLFGLASIRFFKNNITYKTYSHHLLLKIPIIGKFVSKVYLAQFTQAVSLLTSSKVPILNSIQMVKKMIDFIPLQHSLQQVEDGILKGKSLSESMQNSLMFDSRIISLIKVAEETNQTEYVFNQLNEQYNKEVVAQSKLVATLLEPLIILFVGGLVAVLLVAMYLPMFQLSSVIG